MRHKLVLEEEFLYRQEEQDNFYDEQILEDQSESDMISAAEEGFMIGYLN